MIPRPTLLRITIAYRDILLQEDLLKYIDKNFKKNIQEQVLADLLENLMVRIDETLVNNIVSQKSIQQKSRTSDRRSITSTLMYYFSS